MRAFFCCFALLFLLPECGAGNAVGSEANSTQDTGKRPSASKEEAASSAEEPSEPNARSDKPRGPSCDDGTCSRCGDGICPTGWYCDEKVGGGACSWLSECATKVSCACITRVLGASCKCHEEDGSVKVACD